MEQASRAAGPPSPTPAPSGLGRFSALTRGWFEGAFAAPTQAQVGAWDALASEQDVLVVAPTGSGKTLAAFLSAIDRLATVPPVPERQRLRVLYISPLKALAADIERNLRAPLAGLRAAAAGQDLPLPDIAVGMRTGDTPAEARRRFTRPTRPTSSSPPPSRCSCCSPPGPARPWPTSTR
jgi:ATP-dependent Lhr-like helicase